MSVGTGSAPVLGATVDDPESNVASAAVNTLSALMAQAAVDQDVNCRVVGRCSFGGVIDRELHDLLIVDPSLHDQPLTLDEDLGRHFLYVRYNAELTPSGLEELGLATAGSIPKQGAEDGRRGQPRRARRRSARPSRRRSTSPISARSFADSARRDRPLRRQAIR